jgi:putative ABC transport system permease protein
MVLTLAIGVAASVATLTILHVMSGDPIPHKSDRLLVPLVDNGPLDGYKPGDKPNDASSATATPSTCSTARRRTPHRHLRHRRRRRAGTQGHRRLQRRGWRRPRLLQYVRRALPARPGWTRPTTRRRRRGGAEPRAGGKLYGDADPVGKRMRMGGFQYQIVGVLDTWNVVPRFHRIIGSNDGAFSEEDELFIPFANAIRHEYGATAAPAAMKMWRPASRPSSIPSAPGFRAGSKSAAPDRAELQSFLDSYAVEQRKLGRLKRAAPTSCMTCANGWTT